MPCDKNDHIGTHVWPKEGPLVIERCERYCDYCDTEENRKHPWKFAWFLRRHVEAVHIKSEGAEYPNVQLADGWTRADSGPRKSRNVPKKKAPARRSKKNKIPSPTLSPSRSPSHAPHPSSASESIAVAHPATVSPQQLHHHSRNNSDFSDFSNLDAGADQLLGNINAFQPTGNVYGPPAQSPLHDVEHATPADRLALNDNNNAFNDTPFGTSTNNTIFSSADPFTEAGGVFNSIEQFGSDANGFSSGEESDVSLTCEMPTNNFVGADNLPVDTMATAVMPDLGDASAVGMPL